MSTTNRLRFESRIPSRIKNKHIISRSKIQPRSTGPQANQELAEYNGLIQTMSNLALLLSPLTREEAVLSSKNESTQAKAVEVMEH
jgi:hypothetical protein